MKRIVSFLTACLTAWATSLCAAAETVKNDTMTYIADLPLWLWTLLIGLAIVAVLLFLLAIATRHRED